MTWVKRAGGVCTWDGGPWPHRDLYPEGAPMGPRARRQIECGTQAGYARHQRLSEPKCDACKAAHTTYERERLQRQRQKENA